MTPHNLVRTLAAVSVLAAAAPAGAQSANCSGNSLNQTFLGTVFSGNTVCGRPGPQYPGAAGDRWQEQHRAANQLWDFKLGAPPDPTARVGDWLIVGTGSSAQMRHTYPPGGATVFNWTVYGPNTNTPGSSVYYFCVGTAEHARAFVRSGQVGCANSFPPLP